MNIAHDLNAKVRTKDVLTEEQLNFNALLLSEATLNGLHGCGFQKPSPIQLKAIPIGKCGFDLMVEAKSGTGKTAVFVIIALELINISNLVPQVLILAPTREIAVQIHDVIRAIGVGYEGLKVESFIGGFPVDDDKKKLRGCHIVVGAPGRIKHLIKLGALNISSVKLFVLDEVDKLLDENFQSDFTEICNTLPAVKQIITSSATYSDHLKSYLEQFMWSPTFVSPNTNSPLLLGLKQFVAVIKCNPNVVHQMHVKTEQLSRLLEKVSFSQCIVFSNYQTRAETISNLLNQKGWNSIFISGAQSQPERLKAISDLKEFKSRVLLSTDVTARGIDASNVDLIINYEVPHDASTYLHRMGRAGRYGSHGVSVTLAADGKELTDFQLLLGAIGGSVLSISKLPDDVEEIPGDLWNCDSSKFEAVFGVVNKCDGDKVKVEISNSVINMKSCKKRPKTVKNSFTCPENKKLLSTDECVDSSLDNDKKCLGDVQKFLDITDRNEKSMEVQLSSLDSCALLDSLASGKQLDVNVLNSDTPTEGLLKHLTNDERNHSQLDSRKRKRRSDITLPNLSWISVEVNDLESKEEVHTEKEVINNANKTLHRNIAFLNIAKLLTDNFYVSRVMDDITKSVSTYLNILKSDDLCVVDHYMRSLGSDMEETLGKLQKGENLFFEEFSQTNPTNDSATVALRNNEANVTQDSEMNPVEFKVNENLEEIFKLGFDYAVNTDAPHWLDVLGEEFEDKMDLSDARDDKEEQSEQEEETTLHVFRRRNKYKRHYRKRKPKNKQLSEAEQHDLPVENFAHAYTKAPPSNNTEQLDLNYYNYPGLYSEYEYSNDENFTSCFEYYNSELTEQAQVFEDALGFEEWFSQWQYQVQGVRDYVQQNVYLQEMNKYTFHKK